jgi:hypothetical protein
MAWAEEGHAKRGSAKEKVMADSIVVKRLVRNLQYRLTYVRIFETYLQGNPIPEVAELLSSLMVAQKSAIAALSSYVRRFDVNATELELNAKLLDQAASRADAKSQLRFLHDGLSRAVTWYRTQLLDRQMTEDADLQRLLLELGEVEAAQLWRTESVMAMLRISVKLEAKDQDEVPRQEIQEEEAWRPRLVDDLGRPSWKGPKAADRPRPSRYRRK